MKTCEYEEQFFVEPITTWRYWEDHKPLVGWDFTHTIYASGHPIWRKDILQEITGIDNLKIEEEVIYYVCDSGGTPVGPARDMAYDFLTKHNIIFPKSLYSNGFETWDKACKALDQLVTYYKKIKSVKMTKTGRANIEHLWMRVAMTEDAERKQNMRDTFESEAKLRLRKDSLRNALRLSEEES